VIKFWARQFTTAVRVAGADSGRKGSREAVRRWKCAVPDGAAAGRKKR
jgi:hypothetical protein